jgi:hypothetical protein
MRRATLAIPLAALVVLSGCAGLGGGGAPSATPDGGTGTDGPGGATETPTAAGASPTDGPDDGTATPTDGGTTTGGDGSPVRPPDPETDVLGWEDGYWYNETVSVRESDGLNDSEFATVVARAKARVEVIRDREFTADKENTTIEFITRDELREKRFFRFDRNPHRDVFWEAVFVVGEDRTVAEELERLYRDVVDGYAFRNRVVLVADDPESPRIDPAVLSHELSHILGGPPLAEGVSRATWDDRHAIRATREGTANFVEARYLDRCGSEWSCIERPPDAGVVEEFDANMGLFLWFAAPYTVGDGFVHEVYRRGGIDAVDEAYRTVPASMEQVIHPEKYPDDVPAEVAVPDRSTDAWERIRGAAGPDEYGESILYAALKSNGVIGGPDPEINEAQRTGLNYSAPATAGWEGDAFVGYASGGSDRYGYVFVSEWESVADARQFHAAYLELVRSHGGTNVEGTVYRIDSGPFADAFRVVRDGTRVVVVNAPTVGDLDEVHPPE